MAAPPMNRRRFLGTVGAVAALGGAGPLTACSGSTKDGGKGTGTNKGVKLPGYVPWKVVEPDEPGDAKTGVMPLYLRYPDDPGKVIDEVPGDGSTVTALCQTFRPLPTPMGKNTYWQELNKQLGVTYEATGIPSGDWSQKLATTVAGGELPDFLDVKGSIPSFPEFLQSTCTDLTPFLSGDAVKKYPALANIPSYVWKPCVVNGAIWALPKPIGKMSGHIFRRDDLIAAKGLDPEPKSFAEFKALCKGMTDPRRNTWAMANPTNIMNVIYQMLGLPQLWRLKDGKLTFVHEFPEAKQAISAMAGLIKAGYAHPDCFAVKGNADYKLWFQNGTVSLDNDNFGAWQGFLDNVGPDKIKIGRLLPPDFDSGSTVNTWQVVPSFGMTVLKKAPEKRVEMLLRVANWQAAPFGSAENLLKSQGVEGVNYTMKDGVPSQTPKGKTECTIPDVTNGPPQLAGRYPDELRASHEFQQKYLPIAVADPTIGFYSETNSRKGGQLYQALMQVQVECLQGRKTLADWDTAVKTWRTSGGDRMRDEYEKAIAAGA